jgi:Fur family ferric uptake transcriptional regulator
MADSITQLGITLKKQGFSLTKPRQVVFEVLQHHEPQTMPELVAACGGKINRASIYRTIALFERLGIAQRLQMGWKYKLELTDLFAHHHHHLTCNRCSKIIPLNEDAVLEARLRTLARAQDFAPTDHQLEIRGLCADCLISI